MRLHMLAVAACLASVLMGAPPAMADAAKDIDYWSTSCTSGLTCQLSYQDGEVREFETIAFIRAGALNAEIELRLPMPPRFDPKLDPNGKFRLSVDGRQVLSLAAQQMQIDAGRRELLSTDQASVLTLLAAMKTGRELTLDFESVAGKFASEMKLDGIRGSLYFIDDVQDRRGRTDALFAIGQTVPEGLDSKDIQTLDDVPASIRQDFTADLGSCTEGLIPEDVGSHNGFDISRAGVRTVLVPCGNGGAYNQPYALYLGYEEGALTRISFPDIAEGRPSILETAENVDFDPVTGIMTSFLKDIGMGTCGLWRKWQFTAEGNLVLLERRGWYECDGSRAGPEDFPLEWPVEKQP